MGKVTPDVLQTGVVVGIVIALVVVVEEAIIVRTGGLGCDALSATAGACRVFLATRDGSWEHHLSAIHGGAGRAPRLHLR